MTVRTEEEIRQRREKLIENKHNYLGFSVDGLELYYTKRDLLDWMLCEEEKE